MTLKVVHSSSSLARLTTPPSPSPRVVFFLMIRPPPRSPLFPYTTLFRPPSDSGWTDRAARSRILERPQQLAERLLAFAANDEIDLGERVVRVGREARIVAAADDSRRGPDRAHEARDRHRRRALKGHHRQTDNVRLELAHEMRNGRADRRLDQDEIRDGHAVVRGDVG